MRKNPNISSADTPLTFHGLVMGNIRPVGRKKPNGFDPTSKDLVCVATPTCEYRVQYPIDLKSLQPLL